MEETREKKPVIGITPQYHETERRLFVCEPYEQAVLAAGGLPVLLPLHAGEDGLRQLMMCCDGFLLTGGPDVSPFFFGEETHEGCGKIVPERDRMELFLAREALGNRLHARKPLLAVCRGIQVLNLAMGGSIYQDVEAWRTENDVRERIAHYQVSRAQVPTHTVLLERHPEDGADCDGWLQRRLGLSFLRTNSFHHQVLKRIAPGAAVCARAKDGAVEAIHRTGHPFCLGVQWHPEDLCGEDPAQRALFSMLIQAAG